MSSQITDVSTLGSALRRRARLIAVAALLGMGAGVSWVILQPPPLTSTTLVLLPTPALAESTNSDVPTQVRIATSASVLQEAGASLVPALSARTVERMTEVTAPTDQLIQIEATSTNADQAQLLSQGVADAYVDYVRDTAKEVTAAALAELTTRRDALRAQIQQLQKEIGATVARQRKADPDSADARKEAQLLAGLRTEQAKLALQLDKVEDKIVAGTPVSNSAAAGTLVVQPATLAIGPTLWIRLLVWAPATALAFALLTMILVIVAARRDPRLRLRDDIADAVGSPVLAAVRSRPQRSMAGWSSLLENYKATPVESWALRQVLRGLVPADRRGQLRSTGRLDYPASLTVVSLAGDARGLAIGPQLAAFAASLGIVTRLVPTIGHVRAPNLWAACAVERSSPARQGSLLMDQESKGVHADLTINLIVAERTHPYLRDTPQTVATLLAVGTSTATEQDLARVAVAVDDAGRRIDGIVVADPDQSDRTSGRHTLPERSRQHPLPTRLTGIAPAESRAEELQRGGS